ncbi:hypothetical protein XU18_4203 [Perkinsela sp. CCAP 1560/4]|nr:hypothetical protein XU18_4203 [Perkinsela sp. CCAP 1560/4]|eukprot:KNH04591.1 hypothetical protein XU18_4203 [Perkinsela sp. CCAP 1560/4]
MTNAYQCGPAEYSKRYLRSESASTQRRKKRVFGGFLLFDVVFARYSKNASGERTCQKLQVG